MPSGRTRSSRGHLLSAKTSSGGAGPAKEISRKNEFLTEAVGTASSLGALRRGGARNTEHLLWVGSIHGLNTTVLRLRQCHVLRTMPPMPVCVRLPLCLTCSSVFSASHHHPDLQREPWLCPSLLSRSLRPQKEDTWLQAELRSRAGGYYCEAARHPRHVVITCLNGVSSVLVNRRFKM